MNNLAYKNELNAKELAMVENEFENKKKNPVIAWVLWLFLGTLGAHRFYLGNTGYAIAMLLLAWATFGVWTLIDAFFIQKNIRKKNNEIELEIINHVKSFSK